ncbi:7TMR-DISM family protein, partial [Oligoflexus tunisiensis]
MKKSLQVVLLLCLAITFSFSERALAEQMILEVNGNQGQLSLNNWLWYQEDPTSVYTAETLADPLFQQRFAPLDRKTPNFGLSGSAWWARVTLKNTSPHPLILYVTQEYAQVDSMDFWQLSPTGEVMAHARGGDRSVRDPNAVSYRLPTFKMELPPGDSVLIMRMQTNGSGLFYVNANTEQNFSDKKTMEYAFIYSMMSILFCMAVYNFCIWLQLRKLVYFVYVIFIVTVALQQLGFSGLTTHFSQDTWFMNEGAIIFTGLSVMAACLFTIMFLSLRNRHPWLQRSCWITFILPVVACLGLLDSYNTGIKLMILSTFSAAIAVTVAGFVCCWNRYRPAYFFTVAWLAVLV